MVLLSLLVTVIAAGCEVDARVGVDVADDGSGRVEVAVTLDPDAAGRVSDLSGQLRVADLTAAGWAVSGPNTRPDGSVVVTATKPFADVADVSGVLDEISGTQGPFGGLEVRREGSFFATTYHLSGVVDLTDGIDGFSDDGLRRRLEGSGFGLATPEVERLTGVPLGESFHVDVRTHLPGRLVEGPRAPGDRETAVWSPEVGETTVVEARSRRLHVARLAWLAGAVVAATALAAVLGARRWRR